MNRLPIIRASVMAIGVALSGVAAGPLKAQPLQLQPPVQTKSAIAKPAAPKRIPMPPVRPADLGQTSTAMNDAPSAEPASATMAQAARPTAMSDASRTEAKPASAPAKAKLAAPATQEEAIERLNAYLNSFTNLQGNFIQFAANGKRMEGRIYIQRPGKMRFEYDPPSTTEIIADGTSVAIREKRLATQDLYSIGQTPLKFLVRDKMDLSREGTITGASIDNSILSVRLEDRSTLGGTSKITLKFDLANNELKQWIVVDPQGYQTSVALYDLDMRSRPDPKNFVIDYQRKL